MEIHSDQTNDTGLKKTELNGSEDWDAIYLRGEQINFWPFSDAVSDVIKSTRGQNRKSLSVLEVGCGTGNNLWFLLEAGFKTAGIDFSTNAIRIAADRLRSLGFSDMDLRVGDLNALPWADETFDIVLDRGVITTVPSRLLPVALNETYRVLRPGGLFLSYYLFGTLHSDRHFGKEHSAQSHIEFRTGRFTGDPLVSFFDKSSIRRLWHQFEIQDISQHSITRDNPALFEERFDVKARRPL